MKVITRDQVKTYLGITDTSLDDQIDKYLPIIDTKVKQITGNRFNSYYEGDTDSTVYLEVYDFEGEALEIGAQLTGSGIPSDAYIEDLYYEGGSFESGGKNYANPVIQLSEAATETESGINFYVGINIAYHPTIAKGVNWLINQENTNNPSRSTASKSMGPVAVSYNVNDTKMDNRYGMPSWFVKGLPTYHRGY